MSLFHKFTEINQRICNKIENILPYTKPDITELYSEVIADYASKKKHQMVVDVGGGRLTPFAKYLDLVKNHKLVVIDFSEEELKKNIYADRTIVADINKELPLRPNSVDLIVSRYVLEHVDNLPSFISHSQKALKNGGYFIHLFSCKFALFALLNQLFPIRLTKSLLNNLVPNSQHIRGFKTYYNYCYYDGIINIFAKKGFSVEKVYLSYYQSRYFSFFALFYIISIFYEIILQMLGLKNLGAYILIIVKKE